MTVFVNIILPVFIMAGLGYLLDRLLALDVRTLSRVTFYLLSPCLAFSSLSSSHLQGQALLHIAGIAALMVFLLWPIASWVARIMGLQGTEKSAFLLTILFVNSGNYGLPLNLFAFGEPGLALAIIFFAANSLLTNTLGVYIAARGHADSRAALRKVFQVPIGYAVLAGLFMNVAGLQAPEPVARATNLLGQAAVPVMLLVLGMQLGRASVASQWKPVAAATALRLVGAMALVIILVRLLGFQGLSAKVSTVQASMPTAVMTTILATEFDVQPTFVTGTVFVSTLASMITLTFLLQWLM
ncbi:MAG: AEC family transporter [Chloroflexi bacterium]|nr:AEC family transporter [Chloroflexota bacterium]